jgi:putative transposase
VVGRSHVRLDGRRLAVLAVVLDLFNREVVGWSIKPRMTSDIVIDALTMAWFRRKPARGLMHHSDRGSHAFQGKLTEYGMVCSMSQKANCWDTQSKIHLNVRPSLTRAGIGPVPLR